MTSPDEAAPRSLEAVARRSVERYLLAAGERVVACEAGSEAASVETSEREWLVRPLERGRNFQRGSGYALYDVSSHETLHAQGHSHGIALLPDGALFHLNDAEEFRAFFHGSVPPLAALETAALLAFYQSTAEGNESVIVQWADLEGLLYPADRARLPELKLPEVEAWEAGRGWLTCCTLYLYQDARNDELRLGLNRWRAWLDDDHRLAWACEPVARRLRCPRYAGPTGR